MKTAMTMFAATLVLVGCREKQTDGPSAAGAGAVSVAREQAHDVLWALPEIKAWAEYVREHDRRPGTMVDPRDVIEIDGRSYWSIRFLEHHPTHIVTWEWFLVDAATAEVFVQEMVNCEIVSLEQWQRDYKPMQRVTKAPSNSVP
ncbi:MAG: hypothetical protein ACYS8X_11430 [Planctomycetota bacterium]|jgi:hypothetical protein